MDEQETRDVQSDSLADTADTMSKVSRLLIELLERHPGDSTVTLVVEMVTEPLSAIAATYALVNELLGGE